MKYAAKAEGRKQGGESGRQQKPTAKEEAATTSSAKAAEALQWNVEAAAEGRERLQRLLDCGSEAAALGEAFSTDAAALRGHMAAQGPFSSVRLLCVFSLCLSVVLSFFLSFYPWGLFAVVLGFMAGGLAMRESRTDREFSRVEEGRPFASGV